MTKINWAGFAKKNPKERLSQIKPLLSKESHHILENHVLLKQEIASQMVENTLGTFALPFSVVPEIEVNHKDYTVPFVTEEPSVVAACSFASQIIKRSGGFKAIVHNRQMIGQIALYDIKDTHSATKAIEKQKKELLDIANSAHPSIVKRGGGASDIKINLIEDETPLLVVHILIDTKEAMGANIVNTMTEALKPYLEALTKGKSLMAILSNYATEALVTANCAIDYRFLNRDKIKAKELAEKMVLASNFAKKDPYRASTHNKGIFNGVDAVCIATGNDWRAIEAGAHAYASRNGHYEGLTTWRLDEANEQLLGEITLPLPLATKGGSIGLNPSVLVAFDVLGNPDAKTLASIVASVGLAQNFAALRALVTEGIQEGHMKLHARSLALLAGSLPDEVVFVVESLLKEKHMNLSTAKKILEKYRNNTLE
ncbi:hydroxymethylglutaryl-CoA reductase, degradative [Streptococcus sp. CSL10205-OR2]|uniref:hydroxymethylglutaryl-CoA reductase, degradative n=1 Tax=Streptococcus sp. CSL10205-OR2 TaxID=2980558 RepID=UPI0021D93067|nr:hydroxymethylglutaryl-CoA reductase, degradative [Streptococcus sp. CSL10205-OR2]MCU9533365.1 hydroxymethylglutaryl-CoA reductase, degradative [Streptococcus sp. CSL10205-OR2]